MYVTKLIVLIYRYHCGDICMSTDGCDAFQNLIQVSRVAVINVIV